MRVKKKVKREEERGGGKPKEPPLAFKGQKVIQRPKAAGFIAASCCWTFGVRVRVRDALL